MAELLWKADLGDGRYKNPVLFADYSDPDVIFENGTYYMTASSFNYIPGLPILTSKDLVNWKLVNYALERIPYEEYDRPQHARGVWAPAIRFHEGWFYIYYGMPDEGIFMVKAKDPLGKWDEPVCILAGKGLIDSCPFWDEDGRAYLVHGYANSRIGFKSHLGMFEMNPEGTEAITEDHIIFCGLETQPTIEGPKVYKFNNKYYILAPAGGVRPGWQTALRSDSISGPFEEMIVCRQGNTDINGPHQGALVCGPDGSDWWFIHFQDRGLYGRISHLQPVTWKDGWPIVGSVPEEGYCGEPVSEYRKPGCSTVAEVTYLQASDDFKNDKLSLCWQWLGNAKDDFYSLDSSKGILKLKALKEKTIWESSNVLTEKIVCPYFKASVHLDVSSFKDGDRAGILMMGGEYAYLEVNCRGGRMQTAYGESETVKPSPKTGFAPAWLVPGKKEKELYSSAISGNNTAKNDNGKKGTYSLGYDAGKTGSDDSTGCRDIVLELELSEKGFGMSYTVNGNTFVVPEASKFTPSDHTWVGAKIGLFGNASFSDFRVEALMQDSNG